MFGFDVSLFVNWALFIANEENVNSPSEWKYLWRNQIHPTYILFKSKIDLINTAASISKLGVLNACNLIVSISGTLKAIVICIALKKTVMFQ